MWKLFCKLQVCLSQFWNFWKVVLNGKPRLSIHSSRACTFSVLLIILACWVISCDACLPNAHTPLLFLHWLPSTHFVISVYGNYGAYPWSQLHRLLADELIYITSCVNCTLFLSASQELGRASPKWPVLCRLGRQLTWCIAVCMLIAHLPVHTVTTEHFYLCCF